MLSPALLHEVFQNSNLHVQEFKDSSVTFFRVRCPTALALTDVDWQLKRYLQKEENEVLENITLLFEKIKVLLLKRTALNETDWLVNWVM